MLYRADLAKAVAAVRDLSEAEWAHFNAHPICRNEGELDALRKGAITHRQRRGPGDDMRADAVTDTLAWVSGERSSGPASGRATLGLRPMLIELAVEAVEVDLSQPDDLDDLAEMTRFERHHTILNTIGWLIKASKRPPISPLPPVELHPPIQLPDESTWPAWFTNEVEHLARGRAYGDTLTILTHPIVRTNEEIEAVVADLRRRGDADALDVIAWAIGKRPEAPWTGRKPIGERPTRVEIDIEIGAIAAVADSSEASEAKRGRAWHVGGALAWLVGNVDDEP